MRDLASKQTSDASGARGRHKQNETPPEENVSQTLWLGSVFSGVSARKI